MARSGLAVATRQPLCPLGSDFRVTFYDDHVLGRYEQAILHVLERTGVRFGSPKALAILEEHGALVDRATQVVRFSPELVKRRAGNGAAQLLPRLPGGPVRPRPRGARHVQHDQRLRH